MNKKEIKFRDPVVERVVDKFVSRSDVGFKKYGRSIHNERTGGHKDLLGYLNDVQEELMDNMEMEWETEHGKFKINSYSIDWIMKNVKQSMYNDNRSYVYNKAFARFYENHQTEDDQTRGRIKHFDYPGHVLEKQKLSYKLCYFDLIREWAEERGLYEKGDPKTQYLKLMEEAGEVGRAILKNDKAEIVDGIGDMVVVLTNLAKLTGNDIEFCIEQAYNEISKRKGKMINGTFVKDE